MRPGRYIQAFQGESSLPEAGRAFPGNFLHSSLLQRTTLARYKGAMPIKKTKKPGFLSYDEVADFLGVNRRTVERLVQKGLPSIRLGQSGKARRLFDPQEVSTWIKAHYRQKS